jgi:hypothetical protein
MEAQKVDIAGIVRVRVLMLIERDRWVAQCLDFDIAAHGKTMMEARNAFTRTFLGQMLVEYDAGETKLSVKPAPQWYFDRYEHAEQWGSLPFAVPGDASPAEAPPMRFDAEVRFVDPLAVAA